ncbi:phosphonate metabolism protein PhnP [Oceanisphaera sp. IT1-181]|uniref:phosphonate metabolism protein PhnP n=1 Tax=Oceanisphaera sp. IT1-181 TaxID=3081199 RepID=UPI0039B620C9
MRLTLLGTGAAGGMPLYGCPCRYCVQAECNAAERREPCSALLEWAGNRLLIDGGLMDLHRRFSPSSLQGILLTHFHVDHVQGLFHLRWGRCAKIPVWCPDDPTGCADLLKHPGCLDFQPPLQHAQSWQLGELSITPLELVHSQPTLGYVFRLGERRLAYLTDTLGLPPQSSQWLHALPTLDAVVIDCSFPPGNDGCNRNHNSLEQVLALRETLRPRQMILTHIGHDFHGWLQQHALPNGVVAGWDNMCIVLEDATAENLSLSNYP